ncbi:HET-domain-containing protein [Hypoxylon rubiginosum]|uniref:HET-domain-containing protein n=1 Tax=Hypoxylon rubiginosum TaxID=110542 RepID=A0ACB9YX75_9PEZI|nr:HET-domain-containing protein [Hypoxylon rubiginosum]
MARKPRRITNRRLTQRNRDAGPPGDITRRVQEDKNVPHLNYNPVILYNKTCEICQKIVQLLTIPPAVRGEKRYELELGSPTQVLSSKCEDHTRLISRCLDVDLRHCQLDSIRVTGFKNADHIQIFGTKGRDWLFRESGQLKLLPTSGCSPAMWGQFMNAKWVDYSLPQRWKQRCDKEHTCTSHEPLGSLKGRLPLWVVDTWQQCLVPCSPLTIYVALSYVWGGTPSFMALRENINLLQSPWSLAEISTTRIPRTIRDAMLFVQRLGERDLWVDSLCIVQDDAQKLDEIANMGAIYAQASITIVAANGDNADYGLRGLRGISGPRSVRQLKHSLRQGIYLIETYGPSAAWVPSTWGTRGWTFQEALFSRRMVTFERGWVSWMCHGAVWEEYGDIKEGSGPRVFGKHVPDAYELSTIITTFTTKNLTYPEDAVLAFSGIASALSSTFHGGFVSGLPVLLFNMALLWAPISVLSRRKPKQSAGNICLPSWSWVGWEGRVTCLNSQAADNIKKCSTRAHGVFLERVSPLVEWSWTETPKGTRNLIRDSWHEHKEMYWNKLHAPCPRGWTRHRINDPSTIPLWQSGRQPNPTVVPLCFYKHESESDSEFWYPLPLPRENESVKAHVLARYITCRTRRAWLVSGETLVHNLGRQGHMIVLRDRQCNWVGALQLCEPLISIGGEDGASAREKQQARATLELVEIAQGNVPNSTQVSLELEEWDQDERPSSKAFYEYYYVLWIEWSKGGLGRVHKDAWESQDREWIDLVLG